LKSIGRVLIVIAVAAVVAAACGAGQFDAFERDAKARAEAERPQLATAEMFRATICASSPCILVEAGGLAFLVGAGEGAAEGLQSRGLMRPNLDGVLLADFELASVEGLPGLRQASLDAGRAEPLAVFGPDGALPVIDGANLMLTGTTSDSARLTVGIEGEDQGLAGKVVFDSGVVTIRAFTASEGASRVYRFDFNGKSLLIAGCAAKASDIVSASRGAKQAAAIIAASSPKLLEIERKAARTAGAPLRNGDCMSADEAVSAAKEARLSAGVLAPLIPAANDSASRQAWKEAATIPDGLLLAFGAPGTTLNLTLEKPVIDLPK
jgi:hypothetical protein